MRLLFQLVNVWDNDGHNQIDHHQGTKDCQGNQQTDHESLEAEKSQEKIKLQVYPPQRQVDF